MDASIFDVIGPVMIGPSSSHTAGSARIGLAINKIMNGHIDSADIVLYNSFAETGRGHGTDMALIGGLIGLSADDPMLRESFRLAGEKGMKYTFSLEQNARFHPNTAVVEAKNNEKTVRIRASSVGGGSIRVNALDNFEFSVSCELDTLLISHKDKLWVISDIATQMGKLDINIASMHVSRQKKGGEALTILELDNTVSDKVISKISNIENVENVVYIPKLI